MLRIHFTSEDLCKVTIANAADPLWDVLLSLHTLRDHSTPLMFANWRHTTLTANLAEIRLLTEVAPPQGYSPDFLTPGRGDEDFEGQLDRVLSSPRRHLHDDMVHLAQQHPATPWTRALAGGDPAALRLLGKAIGAYHRAALAPYADRIQTYVRADRSRRSQIVLDGGLDRLLSSLHSRSVWQPPVLRVPVYADQDVYLQGRGLVLVPSVFCRVQPITLRDPHRPPVLVYPLAPPLGLLRAERTPDDDPADPVAALIGRTRMVVLAAAINPGTTTKLAQRVGIAPPVVSRHTAVLRAAGLLETHRDGGSVRHRITGLGIAVLNGALPT
jgi:DNA-binding transcriptional ArsR family regulator